MQSAGKFHIHGAVSRSIGMNEEITVKPRAIIIDDDESCREVLVQILRQKGYEAFSFPDPTVCPIYAEGKCTCPQEYACGDFLLTDNRMPRMSGLAFVEAQTLRGCKGSVSNKAVISGTWEREELAKAERFGCKIFRKPFRIDELLDWLEERRKMIPPWRKLVVFDSDALKC